MLKKVSNRRSSGGRQGGLGKHCKTRDGFWWKRARAALEGSYWFYMEEGSRGTVRPVLVLGAGGVEKHCKIRVGL